MLQMIHNADQFRDTRVKIQITTTRVSTMYIPHFIFWQEELLFTCFLVTLRDEAKRWVRSLEAKEVWTWEQLIKKFMKKFFSPHENTKRWRDIMNFWKKQRDNLHDVRSRYKRLVKACPYHGISKCILMEVFYDGINKTIQQIANVVLCEEHLEVLITRVRGRWT